MVGPCLRARSPSPGVGHRDRCQRGSRWPRHRVAPVADVRRSRANAMLPRRGSRVPARASCRRRVPRHHHHAVGFAASRCPWPRSLRAVRHRVDRGQPAGGWRSSCPSPPPTVSTGLASSINGRSPRSSKPGGRSASSSSRCAAPRRRPAGLALVVGSPPRRSTGLASRVASARVVAWRASRAGPRWATLAPYRNRPSAPTRGRPPAEDLRTWPR